MIKLTLSVMALSIFIAHTSAAAPPRLMERRIWIDKKAKEIEDDQCGDKQVQWRCIYPVKADCINAAREAGKHCRVHVVPDLPEYVDGEEGEAKALKIVTECLTVQFSKKNLIGMPKATLDAYNECTGAVPRSKPIGAGFQKALEFSKTQTSFSCAEGSYLRKCFGYTEPECKSLMDKSQLTCTMRSEASGTKVKDEPKAVEEAGKKITDCALAEARNTSASSRKKSSHKDCL